MEKNLKDIVKTKKRQQIILKKNDDKKNKPLQKKKYSLNKQKSPIIEVKDLSGEETGKYIYIKGKKFTPPKYLGNLIRFAVGGFLIILIINVINVYFVGKKIESNINKNAYEGYNYLLDAGKSATKIQFDNALSSFNNALEDFSKAQKELWFINTDYSLYNQNSNVGQAVNALLEGGKYFSIAGKYFLEAIEEFNKIPIYFVSKNTPQSTENNSKISITDSIKEGLSKTDLAVEQISLAAEKIKNINEETLPAQLQARVSFIKSKVEEISQMLEAISKHFPAILKLLGDEYPHRYLILLQNNNEIRPTGGFIGSYAIVDVNEGYIEKLETHDVYDIDGAYGGVIEPPEELKAFTSNWRFRDSNYSPDFAVSAAKARWFLEKEGGPTVDTVIAINQGLLKDMLEITGPIQVGQFGKLDANNYNLLLSFVIEGKIWGEEDPKHLLKVFIPAFKNAILKAKNISKVTGKLYKAIQQKHILFYSSDEEIEAFFDAMGVSGKVYRSKADEDYLSVINISTGGTKSDQFIDEDIHHHTYIDENGNIIDEVKIKRSHLWTDDIYFQWKKILNQYGFTQMPDEIIDILGRGANKVSTRIYVPEGSKLLDSSDPNIETKYDKDLNKTYFFTKMEAKAGETQRVWVKYKLPFNINFNPIGTYKLIVEKQPGSRGSIFTKTVSTNELLKNLSLYPQEARLSQNNIATYAENLVYDKYFAGIWGK